MVLLLNELAEGERLINQLQKLSWEESLLSPVFIDKHINHFKLVCAEARDAWALAVFSASSDSSLERYFTYHLQVIAAFSDRLSYISERGNSIDSRIPEAIIYEFNKACNDLIAHLFTYFSPYLDDTVFVPPAYHQHVVSGMEDIFGFINRALPDKGLPDPLHHAVSEYIKHFTGLKDTFALTFGQLHYFGKFISEIKLFLCNNDTADITQRFAFKLLELDFNHLDIFSYLQDETRSKINRVSGKDKLLVMEKYAGLFSLTPSPGCQRYSRLWPPLSQMLAAWLQKEMIDSKSSQIQDRFPSPNLMKMKLNVSVAHLACLVKLLVKEGFFGTVPLTEIFRFIAANYSTKRVETISPGSLSKEYYSVEQVTAAEIKGLLQKMTARISMEYFPVVAAAGIIVHFH